jgi:MFS family permease
MTINRQIHEHHTYPWIVLALLVPVALLNYLDRQMLATMKVSVLRDIPSITSKADWGMVLATFKWTYAVLSPFGGMIADRMNKARIVCVSLLLWSAVTWLTGQVTTFHELLAARAIMGVSEAFYIPTALALIAEYHTGFTRSRATGVHQSGIYIGSILGGFAGYVADDPNYGWQWAFSCCGIIGICYALPLFTLLRSKSENTHLEKWGALPATIDASPRSGLLGNRNFILLVLYFTLPAIAGWVVRDWMPDILRERFGLGQGKAGVSAILFVQIASVIGVVAGGLLADRWMSKSIRGRIFTSTLGVLLFLPALFTIGSAETLFIAVLGLSIFGLGWGLFDCNNMPILCQIVGPNARATGYGIMNLFSISCGGFGDWAFGAMRDRNVSLSLIFGTFAGIALTSVVLALLIKPTPQPAQS